MLHSSLATLIPPACTTCTACIPVHAQPGSAMLPLALSSFSCRSAPTVVMCMHSSMPASTSQQHHHLCAPPPSNHNVCSTAAGDAQCTGTLHVLQAATIAINEPSRCICLLFTVPQSHTTGILRDVPSEHGALPSTTWQAAAASPSAAAWDAAQTYFCCNQQLEGTRLLLDAGAGSSCRPSHVEQLLSTTMHTCHIVTCCTTRASATSINRQASKHNSVYTLPSIEPQL